MTRTCPSCGSGRVRVDGGCPLCLACGWSKCTPVRADGGREPLYLKSELGDRYFELMPTNDGMAVVGLDISNSTPMLRFGSIAKQTLKNVGVFYGLQLIDESEVPDAFEKSEVQES